MNTQHDINLTFINQKGFDTTSLDGLKKALSWLQTTDADMLMHGEGNEKEKVGRIKNIIKKLQNIAIPRDLKSKIIENHLWGLCVYRRFSD